MIHTTMTLNIFKLISLSNMYCSKLDNKIKTLNLFILLHKNSMKFGKNKRIPIMSSLILLLMKLDWLSSNRNYVMSNIQ